MRSNSNVHTEKILGKVIFFLIDRPKLHRSNCYRLYADRSISSNAEFVNKRVVLK